MATPFRWQLQGIFQKLLQSAEVVLLCTLLHSIFHPEEYGVLLICETLVHMWGKKCFKSSHKEIWIGIYIWDHCVRTLFFPIPVHGKGFKAFVAPEGTADLMDITWVSGRQSWRLWNWNYWAAILRLHLPLLVKNSWGPSHWGLVMNGIVGPSQNFPPATALKLCKRSAYLWSVSLQHPSFFLNH